MSGTFMIYAWNTEVESKWEGRGRKVREKSKRRELLVVPNWIRHREAV